MKRIRPPSAETRKVLACLSDAGAGWTHGYDMMRATGIKSGSLYPILMRLADRGLLEACWQEPVKPGRPARHAYRLTAAGRDLVRALSQPQSDPAHVPTIPDGTVAAAGRFT